MDPYAFWSTDQIEAEERRIRAEISALRDTPERVRAQAIEGVESATRYLTRLKKQAQAQEPAPMPDDLSCLSVSFQKCKTCNEAHMIVSYGKTDCCPETKPTQLTMREMAAVMAIQKRCA